MRRCLIKYYFKLKSYIMSAIKREEIIYVDGRDISPLCEVYFFDGKEVHK